MKLKCYKSGLWRRFGSKGQEFFTNHEREQQLYGLHSIDMMLFYWEKPIRGRGNNPIIYSVDDVNDGVVVFRRELVYIYNRVTLLFKSGAWEHERLELSGNTSDHFPYATSIDHHRATLTQNIPKKTLMEEIKSWISSPYYAFGGIFEGLRTRNCYKTGASRGNKYTSVLDFKFHSDFISM